MTWKWWSKTRDIFKYPFYIAFLYLLTLLTTALMLDLETTFILQNTSMPNMCKLGYCYHLFHCRNKLAICICVLHQWWTLLLKIKSFLIWYSTSPLWRLISAFRKALTKFPVVQQCVITVHVLLSYTWFFFLFAALMKNWKFHFEKWKISQALFQQLCVPRNTKADRHCSVVSVASH